MATRDLIQIALESWGAVLTLFCAATTIFSRKPESRRSDLLTGMLLATSMLLFFDAMAILYRGDPSTTGFIMVRLSNFMVFALNPILVILTANFLREVILFRGGHQQTPLMLYLTLAMIGDVLLIFFSQFSDFLYYFDELNYYHRSTGYLLCSILAVSGLNCIAAIVIFHRQELSRMERLSFLGYTLLPLSSNIFQFFHYGLSLNNLAITASMLLVFLTHVVERSSRLILHDNLLAQHEIELTHQAALLAQKDAELAESRIRLSMSQMQPHFLFNALGSIEQLCQIDPGKAADATHQLASYLRGNLDAMQTTGLITFEEEMRHVRAYVWLEQMRFGEDLNYQEDISATAFRVPALSIQPLVENSINHGMMGMDDGTLNVTLSTREIQDAFHVTVSDNGGGFDVSQVFSGSLSSAGISNVSERVRALAHGRVDISSIIGAGTTAAITIPKEQQSA